MYRPRLRLLVALSMSLAAIVWGLLRPSPSGASEVNYVVLISLDGLGAKYLQFYVTNAPEQFPRFVQLMSEGAHTMNARCDYDISETVPNHATMFTGRPVFQPAGSPDTTHHGYNNNFPGASDTFHNSGNPNVPYKASFFDVAHDYGLSTALYTGKTRLAICERSYNEFNGALDLFGEDNGRDKIDFASVADVSGNNISNEVNLLIQDLTGPAPKRYSFIHIAEPDLTGHASGWGSANWSNAVRNVDAQLGRILDAVTTNGLLAGRTALIVAADHGGGGVIPNGHTESYHITNYTIPFFLWGPGVPGGADLYSVISNRADPGTNRADYSVSPQPIRAGDGGNLALSLLGLPPIPGSYFLPELKSLQPPLAVNRTQTLLTLSWPANAERFFLEFSDTITDPVWRKVLEGIVTTGGTNYYTVDLQVTPDAGFFRLRTSGLSILTQPKSQSVFAGHGAAFQVAGRGSGPLHYQWYFGGRRLAGATNAILTLPSTVPTNAGGYRVIVADYRDAQISDTAALTVLTAPVITQQPQQQFVASNRVALFTVQASGVGTLRYQWKKDGTPLDGRNSSSLSVSNVTLASEGMYSVEVSDDNGATESLPARLAVLIPIIIVEGPASQTVQAGQDATFSVRVSGNPLPIGYEWRKGTVPVASNTVFSTTASFTITNAQPADAGQYSVFVRNAASPGGRVSFPGTLTVLTNAP